MAMHPPAVSSVPENQLAGRLAIVSGALGIVGFACLLAFLFMRPSGAEQQTSHTLLRTHDAGVIVQSLCMIPFIMALGLMARPDSAGSGRATGRAGISFLALIVVLLLLSSIGAVADVLYMIPQGAFGVWLVVVCQRKASGLPVGLRWLGTVAGAGLILTGIFPIGYAAFVDTAILHGPISDDDPTPAGTDRANGIVHILLAAGTMVGCSLYPVWSILAGRWLLLRGRRERKPTSSRIV